MKNQPKSKDEYCESCECDPCDCDWGLYETSDDKKQESSKSNKQNTNRNNVVV